LNYGMEKIPIPLADAYKTIHEQMINDGVDGVTAKQVIGGLIIGAIASGGIKLGNAPKDRPSPYNEEDKKDPTFKYYIDKGLNLPNTVIASESVPNTGNKISDYPKAIQDKYQEAHKQQLKIELNAIKKKGYVYVSTVKNLKGETVIDVATNKVNANYKKTPFNTLTNDELTQVLHIAQSQATAKAKKKIFK